MNFIKDIVKMVNTARGKEKMFGYKSTLANQFYLTYILAGKIYVDRRIHWQTKFTMCLMVISTSLVCTYSFIGYLIIGDKNDIQLMLYVTYSTTIMLLAYIVEPLLAVYYYGNDLINAIQIADHIITKRSNCRKLDNEMDVEHTVLFVVIGSLIPGLTFFFIAPISVLFFNEIEKTRDYNYYLTYLPKIEEWGSMEIFYLFYIIGGTAASSLIVFWIAMTIIVVVFAGICHNEAQQIANDMNSLSIEDITSIEFYIQKTEPKFQGILLKSIRNYQDLMRMLQSFCGFYKTLSAFVLLGLLYVDLSHAINLITPGASLTVKIKEASAFIASSIVLFAYCWVGDILEEITSTVSFAVYSLPWYWSTIHRRDVYLFLTQTGEPTDQKAMSVYPLQLKTFLRFLNVVHSAVNLIRATSLN